MAEIDDNELARLRALAASGAVAERLWADPKHGREFQKLVKQAHPDARVPELDALEPVNAEVRTLRDQLEALKTDREREREDAALHSQIDRARATFDLTDAGVDKLKQTMLDHKIADPMVAAELLTTRQAREAPTPAASSEDGIFSLGDPPEDSKAALADPIGWAKKELMAGFAGTANRR